MFKLFVLLTFAIYHVNSDCTVDLPKLQKLYDQAEKWHNYKRSFGFGPHTLQEYTHNCVDDVCLMKFKVAFNLGYSYTEKYQRIGDQHKILSGQYEFSYSDYILCRVDFESVDDGFNFHGTPDENIFIRANNLDENIPEKMSKTTWDNLVKPNKKKDRGVIDNNLVCQIMFEDLSPFRRVAFQFDETARSVLSDDIENFSYEIGSCNHKDSYKFYDTTYSFIRLPRNKTDVSTEHTPHYSCTETVSSPTVIQHFSIENGILSLIGTPTIEPIPLFCNQGGINDLMVKQALDNEQKFTLKFIN